MDLVGSTDIISDGARVGQIVRTANVVIEQPGRPRKDLRAGRVDVVVVESSIAHCSIIHRYKAEDIAIVAEDHIRVAAVAVIPFIDKVALLITQDFRACPSKDRVRAIRPLQPVGEAEQIGAAADDVVLPEVAEDHVAAAVALNIVITIERILKRRPHLQRAHRDYIVTQQAAVTGCCHRLVIHDLAID